MERRKGEHRLRHDNDCGVLLMPSTLSVYPQVISRRLASFRVVEFDVSAAHGHF
jgi:hypothetical protein